MTTVCVLIRQVPSRIWKACESFTAQNKYLRSSILYFFFTLINEKTVGDAGPSKFSKVKQVVLVSQSR